MNSDTTQYFLLSVASILHGQDGVPHAMVLDIFDKENDKLIFKNTHDQDGQSKQVEVGRTHPNAPEELYFVHIEVKDIDNLPGQEERSKAKAKENGTYIGFSDYSDSDSDSLSSGQEEIDTMKRKPNENAVIEGAKRVKN